MPFHERQLQCLEGTYEQFYICLLGYKIYWTLEVLNLNISRQDFKTFLFSGGNRTDYFMKVKK